MTSGVGLLVALGIAAVVLIGIGTSFDTTGVVILGFIVLFGALAVAVARKARSGSVAPGRCASCGGLISPNAPYCKHCGEPTASL